MRIRTAAFVAAAAALGVLAGCGDNKCGDQTPPIAGVPNCTAAPGSQVTVPLHVCPKCDQGAASCTVDMTNVGRGSIELVPLSPVCDANSSCPIVDPDSCPAAAVNCTFAAPAEGHYTIAVVTPDGTQIPNKTLDVSATGSYGCEGFSL